MHKEGERSKSSKSDARGEMSRGARNTKKSRELQKERDEQAMQERLKVREAE